VALIDRVLHELEPDLRVHDEYTEVRELLKQLIFRGTSADRQRSRYCAEKSLPAVVHDLVTATTRGVSVDLAGQPA
jgi:hypothetical protein